MPKGLAYTGYILALVGGILLIIFSGLSFLGLFFSSIVSFTFLQSIGRLARDSFNVILGIIAIIGSRYVRVLGWAIALLVIGIIAGGLAGLLIIVGAVLGLIAKYA